MSESLFTSVGELVTALDRLKKSEAECVRLRALLEDAESLARHQAREIDEDAATIARLRAQVEELQQAIESECDDIEPGIGSESSVTVGIALNALRRLAALAVSSARTERPRKWSGGVENESGEPATFRVKLGARGTVDAVTVDGIRYVPDPEASAP